ncbi:unnamed protein product [Orchesella dallaii]|uniref:C2H2-type domain-containing protein n=1 Tax=Orchesella dallaii TaxID=48710 RepID=A0ABP1SAC9_9HEXA
MPGNTCLVCLKSFPSSVSYKGNETDRLLSSFWNFAKHYLRISTETLDRANRKAFCHSCGNIVDSICQLYSDLLALQLRLSSKLGDLGDLLNNSNLASSNKQLGHLLLWKIAKHLNISKVAYLNDFRTSLLQKCEVKKNGSMPQVKVERLKLTDSGFPLQPLINSNSLSKEGETQAGTLHVEYIMVENDEEIADSSQFSPASYQDCDDVDDHDYDHDMILPSPNPSNPSSLPPPETQATATDTEPEELQKLSKQMQKALELIELRPTTSKKHEPKQKKMLKKEKLKSCEELDEGSRTRRRKSVPTNLYEDDDEEDEEDEDEMEKRDKDEEYIPEKPVPSFLSDKDLKPVKGRTISFFKINLTRIDSGEKYECTKCKAVVENRWDILRAHVVKEHTDRFLCSQCGKRFGRKCKYNQHLQSHKKTARLKSAEKEACKICGRPCKILNMKDHLWTHYSEEDKTLALERGEKLPYRKNKQFHCDQCFKSFYSMGKLEAHFKETHDVHTAAAPLVQRPKKKKRLCTVCGAHVHNLVNHMKNHKAYEERQFVCVACDKKFLTQYCLQIHKSHVHLNEKPYQCGDCGRSFKGKQSLKLHRDKGHEKAKVYQCEKCPMKFRTERWYDKHVMEKHVVSEAGGRCEQLAASQAKGLEEEQTHSVDVKHQHMKLDNEQEQFQAVNVCEPTLNAGYQLPTPHHFFY